MPATARFLFPFLVCLLENSHHLVFGQRLCHLCVVCAVCQYVYIVWVNGIGEANVNKLMRPGICACSEMRGMPTNLSTRGLACRRHRARIVEVILVRVTFVRDWNNWKHTVLDKPDICKEKIVSLIVCLWLEFLSHLLSVISI